MFVNKPQNGSGWMKLKTVLMGLNFKMCIFKCSCRSCAIYSLKLRQHIKQIIHKKQFQKDILVGYGCCKVMNSIYNNSYFDVK